ncbi:hypothetical protein Q7P35_010575 [Cladosporium inversicolor]
MVAGKNTTNQLARAAAAPKLPPLPKLRVRKPDQANANPCLGVMTTMLGCWASSGHTAQGCAALEQSLRDCMAVNRPKDNNKNKINQTLSRLYPLIKGPHKKN